MAVIPKLSQARRKHFLTLLPDKVQKNGPLYPQILRVGGFLCFGFLERGSNGDRRWIVCRDWEWRHKWDTFAGHRRLTALPAIDRQQPFSQYLNNKRVKFEAPDTLTFEPGDTEAWIERAEWISKPNEAIAEVLAYFWPALMLLQDEFRIPELQGVFFDPLASISPEEKQAFALAANLALTDWPAAKKRFETEKRKLAGRTRSLEYYTATLQEWPGRIITYDGYKWNPGPDYAEIHTDAKSLKVRLL